MKVGGALQPSQWQYEKEKDLLALTASSNATSPAVSGFSKPTICQLSQPGFMPFKFIHSNMFSQQSPPHFGQQANTSMYSNNMNISVSMATNTGGMSSMNQMTGQISMTSVTSVPTSGLSSMGPEQVNDPALRGGNLFPNQLPGMDMIKQEGDTTRKYC
ncbi:hypothetical protein H8959_003697 [Pygathrix nigripes]